MNSQLFSSSLYLSLLCSLLVILLKIQSCSSNPPEKPLCSAQFKCGNITARYPFSGGPIWDGCGPFEFKLTCEVDRHDLPTMMINHVKYRVLEIKPEVQILRIARMLNYLEGFCPIFHNTTFDSQFFNYIGATENENVTLNYNCPPFPQSDPFDNAKNCQVKGIKYKNGSVEADGANYQQGGCNASVIVPVPRDLLPAAKSNWSHWQDILQQGFELKWEKPRGMPCESCTNSKGSCGFDYTYSKETVCYCPHIDITTQPLFSHEPCPYNPPAQVPQAPPPESSFIKRWKLIIGIAAGIMGIVIIITSIFLRKGVRRNFIMKNKIENCQNTKVFVRNLESFATTRYKYIHVKKMTKSFSNKLGQGGYGDVYQGELPDGRLVAVKLLKGSKGNGEEFTNEVASISRTSHVNIVKLLGFCYERNKRALIYEFMPNGSLDKFIYNEASIVNHCLEWKTMYHIAIGIARGLEYLHRGCNTRIVHFDIKPHNILLDEDFCPKISDFGLAKLCKKKESVVSMLVARGTIGYIAPEVFCRNFGEVSYKSDIYSYGMMIFEMVGGRKNIDVNVSQTSEIYFPHWIYKQLESGYDFEFHRFITEEEKKLTKKMIIVSLWCIQTLPSDRPSMTKVVEMLEGDLESLQVPPNPSLASQIRSSQHFSATSSLS